MEYNNEVEVSQEGYLFLIKGNHKVLEYFTGNVEKDEKSVENFWFNISKRELFCSKRNIEYRHFVFPDKLYMLKEQLNHNIVSLYKSWYESEIPQVQSRVIYLEGKLFNKEALYYRTDTHFNVYGELDNIQQIMTGHEDAFDAYKDKVLERLYEIPGFVGDLGKKCTPVMSEESVNFTTVEEASKRYSNGLSKGNDGIIDIYINQNALYKKTVLIFGDSFFRSLLRHLSYFYQKVVFCRSQFFYPDIVLACSPDIVWSGNAERYCSTVQRDSQRKNFFVLPLLKEAGLDPTPGFGKVFREVFQVARLTKQDF